MTIQYTTSFGTNNKKRFLPVVGDHYRVTQNDGEKCKPLDKKKMG
jgi:hypothetical protein